MKRSLTPSPSCATVCAISCARASVDFLAALASPEPGSVARSHCARRLRSAPLPRRPRPRRRLAAELKLTRLAIQDCISILVLILGLLRRAVQSAHFRGSANRFVLGVLLASLLRVARPSPPPPFRADCRVSMQSSMNSSGDIARKCKPPFNSLTGSSRGIVRRNGEVTALSHPVSNGSWKESEASAVRMQSDSISKLSYKDPNVKQALTAYHPNAPRSRLPLQFKGEAQPFRRFCAPRNCTSPE
eukprot:5574218-Pleurochrysis_carterae.AAC.4